MQEGGGPVTRREKENERAGVGGRRGAAGRGRFIVLPGFQGRAKLAAAAAQVGNRSGRCAPCPGGPPRPRPSLPLLTSV